MANVNEINVGSTVIMKPKFIDIVKEGNLLFGGIESDAFGVVVAVEPTADEIINNYKGINPFTDTANKVVYYDVTAGRHFIARVEMLDVISEGGLN